MKTLSELLGSIVMQDKDMVIELLYGEVRKLEKTVQTLRDPKGSPDKESSTLVPALPRQGAAMQPIEVNMDKITPPMQPAVEQYMNTTNSRFSKLFGLENMP